MPWKSWRMMCWQGFVLAIVIVWVDWCLSSWDGMVFLDDGGWCCLYMLICRSLKVRDCIAGVYCLFMYSIFKHNRCVLETLPDWSLLDIDIDSFVFNSCAYANIMQPQEEMRSCCYLGSVHKLKDAKSPQHKNWLWRLQQGRISLQAQTPKTQRTSTGW